MNTETQIRRAFEQGKTLTVLTALEAFSTYELKRYVYLLKKAGMNIVDRWKKNDNTNKHYKEYWLKAA